MGSVLAIVSKAVFEKTASDAQPGDVFATDRYLSGNKAFTQLGKGDAIFLVTVRPPEKLWLVGILKAPKKQGNAWVAADNTTPIRDITGFVKAAKGKLAMSLQSPRVLDDDAVTKLRASKASKGTKPAQAGGRPPEVERALKLLTSGRRAKDQDDVVAAALFAVDYPGYDRPLPIADSLAPVQLELARALADRPEISTGRWAYPGTAYSARRWLGQEKGGVLERDVGGEPMWRVMQKSAAAAREQFDALSTREALEVVSDVHLSCYRLRLPKGWDFAKAIGKDLGDAGAREADRAVRVAPGDEYQIEIDHDHAAAVLLAIVRGGGTIAAKWDELVAAAVQDEHAPEILRAVPEPRRGKAIARWIGTTHTNTSFPRGVELLQEFPSVDAVRGILRYPNASESVPVADLEKIADETVQRELTAWKKQHGIEQAKVAASIAAAPKLKVARTHQPRSVADLLKIQRAQLTEMANAYDGKKLPLAKRFGDGPDAHGGTLEIRELVDAKGKRMYDVLTWLADDGCAFKAGTTEVVAHLVQHTVDCDDTGLDAALSKALRL